MLPSDPLNPIAPVPVPLGEFKVDEVGKRKNTISLLSLDYMTNLDKDYAESNLIYPATLLQIYLNICTDCSLQPSNGSFLNDDYVVTEKPVGDYTYRDIFSAVAELSGSFGRMSRTGRLELVWFTATGITLTTANRFNFVPSDKVISIKGITATVNETKYLAGTDEYAIDLTENPLLQSNHGPVLLAIFNKVKVVSFYPYTSNLAR